MRSEAICLTFAALFTLQTMGAPLLALACLPSKTWTTGPDKQGDFVLAEGGSAAVRMAGPFEVPWALALLPDGSFLVTERPGRLQHVRSNAETNPVAGIPPVFYVGHGGLLDVAADPEFEENHFVYLSYLQGNETASVLRVLRARFDEANEALTEAQVIFESTPGPRPEQIGGRIALTGDGYLFIALGDRWDGARARPVRYRGLDRAHQDRRHRARRQSLQAGNRRAAGDLELWSSQSARPRLRSRHRAIVVGRARPARRR